MLPDPSRGNSPQPRGLWRVHSVPPPPVERVALIQLLDAMDAPTWFRECTVLDEAARHANSGTSSDPSTDYLTLLTYPHLQQVDGVTWVYVAWRGAIRWKHLAAQVETLQVMDLRNMDPRWASSMKLGARYLWVHSFPHPVEPAIAVPDRLRNVPGRYGLLTPGREQDGGLAWL
jgi:hypothetical protein